MESPFYNTHIECPVCGSENSHDTIRVGAYVEEGRDNDFCPTGIRWRFPQYQNHNPLLYFVATCPKCYFSHEFTDSYKNWKSDTTFKTYRQKRLRDRHNEALSDPNGFVAQLGNAIDIDNAPNESAICKLLLAIFDEQLNERPSHLDLGRLYVRIAWVFRYMTSPIGDPIDQLDNSFVDVDHAFRRWSETYHQWIDARQRLFHVIHDKDLATACIDEENKIQEFEKSIRSVMNELANHINQQRDNVSPISTHGGFGGSSSFRAFLSELKAKWQSVPSDEIEAMRVAIEEYRQALETGKEVSAGSQQAQVCYLIGELSRRVGDYDTAREFFNGALKAGQEFIHKFRNDASRTALVKKVLEMAMEQNQLAREQARAETA